jgi:hypothetical protein
MPCRVKLSAYDLDFSKEEYEAWVHYAKELLENTCGIPLVVEAYDFHEGFREEIMANDHDKRVISMALDKLHHNFCQDDRELYV